MLVALTAAVAAAVAPLPGCDRPLPRGPAVPAAIVLRTACGGFLLRRDGRIERLSGRWLRDHSGVPARRHAADRQVGVNRRGAVVVRRNGVRIWRASRVHFGITPVFGADGALAFGAYDDGVYLTDLRSPERLVVREPNSWPLAFGADGHLVVRTGPAIVVLRPDGTPLRRVPYRSALGTDVDLPSGRVYAIAPDDTLTAVDGARVRRLGRLAGVRGWLTSATRGRFAFLEARRARVWGADGRLVAQAGWPRSLAADAGLTLRGDGRAAAFRLSDAYPGAPSGTAHIRVLDEATGRAREIYRHRLGASGCAVGGRLSWRGGALLYGAYDGHVAVLDPDGGRPIRLTRLARALAPDVASGVGAAWLADYRPGTAY